MNLACLVLACQLSVPVDAPAPRVEVRLPAGDKTAIDGRLLLILAKNFESEPRTQVNDGPKGAQVFGADVDGAVPGSTVAIDANTFGFPLASLRDVPAGDYFVQAVLHRYETFHRADGHVVKLPMDRGEGQQWNRAPGNAFSTPQRLHFDPAAATALSLTLDQVMPPIEPVADTKYVQHVRIKSELLSRFWGRDMYLGAIVLLPEGFDEHPDARYPLVLNHGHFERTFDEFREAPPDPDLAPDYSDRFRLKGYNRIQQEEGHAFFEKWISPGFPRFLVVKVQHANPYYDDSYAVNSANVGPYGDAIMRELLPYVEKRFRGIGQGWARFTYGGSTGGWEALAAQVFYPDEFNGCFAACPDPIDFRAYCLIDLYSMTNAYYTTGDFGTHTPIPSTRDHLNRIKSTAEQANHLELVLGTKSRSGQQFDIWEAVYSPTGADGYPARIFDKSTGAIDPAVAAYWQQNYDLRAILERDWATLGPKLVGKIHIYCGTLDNYYLDSAVYLMEEFLEGTTNPHFGGIVDYGVKDEHCWNGDHENPNAIARLRYHTMYVDRILERIEQAAPAGADKTSWRY